MNLSRLTLIGFTHKKNKINYGDFVCKCGNKINVSLYSVKSGNTKSCGCLQAELRKLAKYVNHGMCNTPTYKSWVAMKRRCIEPSRIFHHGRGITYCERWESFENFLSDMGERPKGKTIDRIDNNGNYEPSNCRWSTMREQAGNRRNSVKLFFNEKLLSVHDWSDITGIPIATIRARVSRYGWSVEKSLTTPV